MSETFKQVDRIGSGAGVPYVAFAPRNPHAQTPLIVALHLMDPPRSERAMAAALPLDGLDAWRVYFGLPMFGDRAPAGCLDEIVRLANEDWLLRVFAPVVEQAAAELPEAVRAVREQLGLEEGPLALIGGSAGGAAVLLALAEIDLPAVAAVLINPASQASAVVEASEALFGVTYAWTDESRAKAEDFDFVKRAPQVARQQTPVHFVIGAEDELSTLPPASKALADALAACYDDPARVSLVTISDVGHALANEPGIEAAPQTPGAALVDAEVTKWLQRYLTPES